MANTDTTILSMLISAKTDIETSIGRELQWTHYSGIGDEIVGIEAMELTKEEYNMIVGLDDSKYSNPPFHIEIFHDSDGTDNNLYYVCLNIYYDEEYIKDRVYELFPNESYHPY